MCEEISCFLLYRYISINSAMCVMFYCILPNPLGYKYSFGVKKERCFPLFKNLETAWSGCLNISMLMGREANGKSLNHRTIARILHAISSIEVTRQQIFFDIARQRIGNVVGNKNDTTACTYTPQKWPKRKKWIGRHYRDPSTLGGCVAQNCI